MPGGRGVATGRFVALSVGLFVVILLELITRQFIAPPPLTLALTQVGATELRALNPQYPQRFFRGVLSGARLQGVRMSASAYLDPDPERPFHVLFVGGSTVQGYPHPRRLSASAFMEQMLADGLGRPVRVFNLGITAVSSFVVARMVETAIGPIDPDLIVVYSGHNDVYGVYGASSGEMISAYWERRLHLALTGSGLGGLVSTALAPRSDTSADASMLEIMSRPGELAVDDPRRQLSSHMLRRNLSDIADVASSAGIPLVLSTLVSNETGFPPSSGVSIKKVDDARQTLRGITASAQVLSRDSLMTLVSQIRNLEDAASAFELARILQRHGLRREAARSYQFARDVDPVPWRATEQLKRVVRSVAGDRGAILADPVAVFRDLSPLEGIGWQLMSDHLHPSAEGQFLLAQVIVSSIRASQPDRPALAHLPLLQLASKAQYMRRQGAFPVEEVAALREMGMLFTRPPLVTQAPLVSGELQQRADSLEVQLMAPIRQALAQWAGTGSGQVLSLAVADRLFLSGRFLEAADYYRATRLEQPFTVMGDLWSALRWGMSQRLATGSLSAEATAGIEQARGRLRFLERSADFDAAFATFFNGYAAYLLADHAVALPLLLESAGDAGLQRTFPFDLMAALSDELARVGRFAECAQLIDQIKRQSGQHEMGDHFLRRLEAIRPPMN